MEKLLMVIRLLAGIFFFVLAVLVMGSNMAAGIGGAISGTVLVLVPAIIAALLLYPFIAAPVAKAFSSLYIFDFDKGTVRKEHSQIRALIAEREYEKAAEQLQQCLDSDPRDVDAKLLLMKVLYDNLGRSEEALTLAKAELENGVWEPIDEQATMIATDIYLDRGDISGAERVLRTAVNKTSNVRLRRRFQERLNSLKQ